MTETAEKTVLEYSGARDAALKAQAELGDVRYEALKALSRVPVGGKVEVSDPYPRNCWTGVIVRTGFGWAADNESYVPAFAMDPHVVERFAKITILGEHG